MGAAAAIARRACVVWLGAIQEKRDATFALTIRSPAQLL